MHVARARNVQAGMNVLTLKSVLSRVWGHIPLEHMVRASVTLVPEHVAGCAPCGEEGLLLRQQLCACLVQPRPECGPARGARELQSEAVLIFSGDVQRGYGATKSLRRGHAAAFRMYVHGAAKRLSAVRCSLRNAEQSLPAHQARRGVSSFVPRTQIV